jgi:hypothetical protein
MQNFFGFWWRRDSILVVVDFTCLRISQYRWTDLRPVLSSSYMLLPARLLLCLNIHKQAKQKFMRNDELWGGWGGRRRFINSLKLFFLPRSLSPREIAGRGPIYGYSIVSREGVGPPGGGVYGDETQIGEGGPPPREGSQNMCDTVQTSKQRKFEIG